jgi:hypothetical protein
MPMTLHDTLVSIAMKRLEDPEQFIKWSELLNNAERTGRIKRAKRSPLAYCLERFTQSAMTDDAQVSSDLRLYFKVDDEVMHVEWKNPHEANSDGDVEVPLPDWAFTFFEEEEHAACLSRTIPRSSRKSCNLSTSTASRRDTSTREITPGTAPSHRATPRRHHLDLPPASKVHREPKDS